MTSSAKEAIEQQRDVLEFLSETDLPCATLAEQLLEAAGDAEDENE